MDLGLVLWHPCVLLPFGTLGKWNRWDFKLELIQQCRCWNDSIYIGGRHPRILLLEKDVGCLVIGTEVWSQDHSKYQDATPMDQRKRMYLKDYPRYGQNQENQQGGWATQDCQQQEPGNTLKLGRRGKNVILAPWERTGEKGLPDRNLQLFRQTTTAGNVSQSREKAGRNIPISLPILQSVNGAHWLNLMRSQQARDLQWCSFQGPPPRAEKDLRKVSGACRDVNRINTARLPLVDWDKLENYNETCF